MRLAAWSAVTSLAWGTCVAVDGERLRAADVARVVPAFAAAPPEAELGYAPAPGTRRWVRSSELARWAARFGLTLSETAPVCFERRMERLRAEQVRAALMGSLGAQAVRLEVIEWSRQPVPPGVLEFPSSGLLRPPASAPGAAVLWKGWVRYGSGRRFPVWARVRILAKSPRVVAAESLKAGEVIRPEQVRLEEREGFPEAGGWFTSVEEVAGRRLLRSVPAGAPLGRGMLGEATEVARGELVRVEAAAGAARVVLEARAESDGARGQVVRVRNPATGKVFRARVEGPGRVATPVVAPSLGERRTP
ncbi:MAG: flagellar basal body P-ring formation chaperone FlgA [Bryobacterales bacterium]|nr:flagellar basal body P-ring formation chaperone FlgA [Bryobacteraceae bacterium]MDW8355268.1 flagellar basal body P-ring formation chaperone FlgA [Bryobacterales bacterium]